MTIAAAEAQLDGLESGGGENPITLPTHGRHHAAGGEAAIVQYLVTWAQKQRSPTIRTHATGSDDVQVDRLVRQLFGVSAALLCDRALAIDGSSIREAVDAAARSRLRVIQGERPQDASRGPQFELLCADHLDLSSPLAIYDVNDDAGPKLKELPAFAKLAKAMIASTVSTDFRQALPSRLDAALGGALHELFRNTEEHGRLDENGDHLRRSIRGAQARRHAVAPAALEAMVAASPPLAAWCARLRPPRESNRDLQFLEMSVFDSGPGYACRWTGRRADDLTAEAEELAVNECFGKHATIKEASSAGLGLPNVVDILRERGGFLRLRTGRQSLYADLVEEADVTFGVPPRLQRWRSDGRRPAKAAGTLVTLLLPLERPA